MNNLELVKSARLGNKEALEEMTQRNLHTVRRYCEQGDFDKAENWLKEKGESL